jgi:transposase
MDPTHLPEETEHLVLTNRRGGTPWKSIFSALTSPSASFNSAVPMWAPPAVYRKKVSRTALIETLRALRPRVIAMEACGSAQYWERRFREAALEVRHISLHYASPFVKTNKNDRNDAEAIVEAASLRS